MQVTIGVEQEMGIVDKNGKPMNVLRELDGGLDLERKFHAVTGELGRWMAEFVTPVCLDKYEVRDSLWQCAESMPKGSSRVHKTVPFGWPIPLAEFKYKPRYPVVRKALRREHPCGTFTLHTVAPHCSTQFQIGVDNVNSRGGVLLRNFLDNIAPFADIQVRKKYNVTDASGHSMIWWGWSKRHRTPGFRWFANAEAMNLFFASIPQLVTQASDGRWVVAENIPSCIGNPLSEGTIWWLARPRGVYQTVEWRSFPALNIEDAAELSGEIFKMMEEFWDYVESSPHREWRTPEDAVDLYRRLSRRYYFVPENPLTEVQWMTLFVQ